MSYNEFSDPMWLWGGEYYRDRVLRDAVPHQTRAMAAVRAAARRDTAGLRSELASMQGSVESRLTEVTNAFVVFVELVGIRKQLEAFPEQARARRYAVEDLDTLLEGGLPPERPDVEGYWLPPAMAALRPDGSLDEDRAALARQRDPENTGVFLTAARTALGAGLEVAHELTALLAPDEEGTWSQTQVLLWADVLRGAFGPNAVARLAPVIRPIIDSADDWQAWARTCSRSASDAAALEWVGTQIEALRPKGTKPEETGPTVSAAEGPNVAAPAFSTRRQAANPPWSLLSQLQTEPEPDTPRRTDRRQCAARAD